MKHARSDDFDVEALYTALDTQRQARGLSWHRATSAINDLFRDVPAARPIATSTLTGMRDKMALNGNVILQVLLWLDRTPERFVLGAETAGVPLPRVGSDRILRWNTRELYEAINGQRVQRDMTWQQAAAEVGCSESQLRGLATSSLVAFPWVMRMVRWLGRPAVDFTAACTR